MPRGRFQNFLYNAGLTAVGALALAGVARGETPEEKPKATAEVVWHAEGSEYALDVPWISDGLEAKLKIPLKNRTLSCSFQQNREFQSGTDFVSCGTSFQLGRSKIIVGARHIDFDPEENPDLQDVLSGALVVNRPIGEATLSTRLVYDSPQNTPDGGSRNFGLIRVGLEDIPLGKLTGFVNFGVKAPDLDKISSETTNSDWIAGLAGPRGGLFYADSTRSEYHGVSGFVSMPRFAAFLYAKDTPEGEWFNVQWARGDVDGSKATARGAWAVAQILGDQTVRPLYGGDSSTYWERGNGWTGLIAGFDDGERSYYVAEIGRTIGSRTILGREVSLAAGGGYRHALEGTDSGLHLRAGLTIGEIFPGTDLKILPVLEGKERGLLLQSVHRF